jgi:hypothetical protein
MTASLNRALRAGVLAISAILFMAGSDWGLPSRSADRFLFGQKTPWTGAQINALAGAWEDASQRGADVAGSFSGGDDNEALNDTDAQRARILRRYRLFSYQPDEWVTFASLARMHPGRLDLDPRVYQYGGAWIYPVGALLRGASMFGLAKLSPDMSWYLDHPEDFGRFYVIARLFSAAWGVAGAWLIFSLIRRIGAGPWTAAFSSLTFAVMPAVLNMAHEAKPHLAVTVATLAAVACASRWLAGGSERWRWGAGLACGLACSLAPTGAASLGVILVMAFRGRGGWARRAAIAARALALSAGVFVVTNPYVPIHLAGGLFHHDGGDALRSNLANTAAMYSVNSPRRGLLNAVLLTAEGTGGALAMIGFFGGIFLIARSRIGGSRPKPIGPRGSFDINPLLLMLAPAAITGGVFAAVGAGKPGEFGRFFLDVDVLLLLLAIAAAVRLAPRGSFAPVIAGGLLVLTAINGAVYLVGFVQDTSAYNTRRIAAAFIQRWESAGALTVMLTAEPAPYSAPPMDLFGLRWRLPRPEDATGPGPAPPDMMVQTVDTVHVPDDVELLGDYAWIPIHGIAQGHIQTPISWASKPFNILVRRTFVQSDDPVGALGPNEPLPGDSPNLRN